MPCVEEENSLCGDPWCIYPLMGIRTSGADFPMYSLHWSGGQIVKQCLVSITPFRKL